MSDPYTKALAKIEELRADYDKLAAENRVLRGLVQTNPEWRCPYGVNDKPSMGFCPLGFPGCDCADDRIAVLCEDGTRIAERVEKLAAKHARLVEAASVVAFSAYSQISPGVYEIQLQRLRALLRDDPETPKGGQRNFLTDETAWEVFPGATAKAQEIIDRTKPDKLALARELAKAARVVVDNKYAPTAALCDALARFEAGDGK